MPTRPIATSIVKKLQEAGFIAYFAGGWVRDFLLQKPSDDIDIATNATTGQIAELFLKTVPVGVAFGIIIVVEEGHSFEIASFRKESDYVDGRRPTSISPATPEEDAQRRDFTINGMFYDPIAEKLYDFVEGEKDLQKGVIKAIGSAHERFLEDKLRMMRAVRYSTRFNFPIESDTLQAILAHAKDLLPAVAMERVWQEFKKMSQFAHFDAGLITLHKLQLLQTIFPELVDITSEEIQNRLKSVEHYPKNAPTIAQLLELFPSYSLEEALILCDYLKISRKERSFVNFLYHTKNLIDLPKVWQKELELYEWAGFYAEPDSELTLQIIAAHYPIVKREIFLDEHTNRRSLLEQPILRIRAKEPIVRAEHLQAEGIVPGIGMGMLLKEAERISINKKLENRTLILEELKKSPLWKNR